MDSQSRSVELCEDRECVKEVRNIIFLKQLANFVARKLDVPAKMKFRAKRGLRSKIIYVRNLQSLRVFCKGVLFLSFLTNVVDLLL